MGRAAILSLAVLMVGTAAEARPLWKRLVGRPAGNTALAVQGDTVVTVTWVGEVVALEAVTGRVRWRRPPTTTDEFLGHHTWLGMGDGVALVATRENATIEGLAVADGQVRWRRELPAAPTSLSQCPGVRAVVATHRSAGGAASTLVATALDPSTGEELWEVPASGDIRGAGEGFIFTSDPTSIGRLPGTLRAIRCVDGRSTPVRTSGIQYPSPVDVDFGRVLLAEANGGRALLVPLEGGHPRLLQFGPFVPAPTTSLLRGNRVYLSTGFDRDRARDSVLVIADLDTDVPKERSAPRTSNGPLLLAGDQIVATYGGSGARDTLSILDPTDLHALAVVPISSAATQLAADEHRVYATTYDGDVVAVALPRPGTSPAPLQAVAPRPRPAPRAAAPASFSVVSERVIDAHPARARTSGSMRSGVVTAHAFVGDGSLLATAGNDDRVHVFRVADGRETWASPALGSDVDHLVAAGSRIAARTYAGKALVWDVDAAGQARPVARLHPTGGWTFALTPNGARVAAGDMDGSMTVLALPGGEEVGRLGELQRRLEASGMSPRGRWVVRPGDDRLDVVDLQGDGATAVAATIRPSAPPEDAPLVQAWARSAREVVAEWCTVTWCEVQILDEGGRARTRARFDVTGGLWSPNVGSTVELSPDGQWIFFHRNGLEPVLLRVSTGERVVLAADEPTRWSAPVVVFSSSDPGLLAVARTPASHQVALYRITLRTDRRRPGSSP